MLHRRYLAAPKLGGGGHKLWATLLFRAGGAVLALVAGGQGAALVLHVDGGAASPIPHLVGGTAPARCAGGVDRHAPKETAERARLVVRAAVACELDVFVQSSLQVLQEETRVK